MSYYHFGVTIHDTTLQHIDKEVYLAAKKELPEEQYRDHYALKVKQADFNYDVNMAYFASLDHDDFDAYLSQFVQKYQLTECFDLNTLTGQSGVYVLVLDEYKQVYIGLSGNLKTRIMQHWSRKMSLDTSIYGLVCDSILSINAFGALDTTRIFYYLTESVYKKEEEMEDACDPRYRLNRAKGGIGSTETYTDDALSAKMAVAANPRRRDYSEFIDIERWRAVAKYEDLRFGPQRYPKLANK